VNLIGNAVHALLTHPGQLQAVLGRHGFVDDVIEETLRWALSIAGLPLRHAVEDIELPGGATIRQGEPILATYAAVGRDPRHHGPGAGEFDVRRTDVEHLSFGHGVHFCLGAPPARWKPVQHCPPFTNDFPGCDWPFPPRSWRKSSHSSLTATGRCPFCWTRATDGAHRELVRPLGPP
jgi:cytochrome P450